LKVIPLSPPSPSVAFFDRRSLGVVGSEGGLSLTIVLLQRDEDDFSPFMSFHQILMVEIMIFIKNRP